MATINRLVRWEQTYNRALPTITPHLFTAPDAECLRRTGRGRKLVGYVLFALMQADFLRAT